ncbi:hypothetical protein JMJ77_0006351 [Colletotrichum scovillei]|uniref:Uncharacterized protein n=1 Tax=Colletotrichum scovillei TaxID=1209932 RepID=A0A9P7RKM4_9PEZI|nr:hypothetical protein JMJ77_0006351 [Colletotrichum scovillei]KAG7077552.1 hypothetical protein JMJ76_0014798 [Colletotrichum scovillei]KAG7084795.1 hypothetical protein JMJ78_0010227 [Colletotrichum scovillei]
MIASDFNPETTTTILETRPHRGVVTYASTYASQSRRIGMVFNNARDLQFLEGNIGSLEVFPIAPIETYY